MDSDGSPPVLQQLVDEHYELVYRFCYRMAGSRSDAEDLVQQTFLTAQAKLDQLREPERARSWLFAIARNAYLKTRRRREKRDVRSLEAVAEPGVDDEVPSFFDRDDLQRALDELSDEYRLPLVLFYFRELSYKEIAETMDVPLGTVMSRLSRGKAALRRLLTGDDATEASAANAADRDARG